MTTRTDATRTGHPRDHDRGRGPAVRRGGGGRHRAGARPAPGRGELLVRVEASSLNALDWHFLTGTPYFIRLIAGLRRPRHVVRGADVAGTVVAVGAGVTAFAAGDEVFGESQHGGFAPYATVKADERRRQAPRRVVGGGGRHPPRRRDRAAGAAHPWRRPAR